MDFANVVTWVIVGAIAGQLVGFLVTGKREGMGWFKNLMLGLAGGFLGGFLFIYLPAPWSTRRPHGRVRRG